MPWSERQHAMLGHMGIRLFQPPISTATPAAQPEPSPARPLVQATPLSAGTSAGTAVVISSPSANPRINTEAPPASAHTPRPLGTEGVSFTALREAVSNCTACKLCEGRSQTVFGTGHAHAHCLIVGEAPGEQEDREGLPFVGKSGQLLDNMLRAIGLTREDASPERQVYITNAVKCRPPSNRNPQPDELAQCEPYLLRQVALLQPRVILAMGRFAVQSLLHSNEPIGRLRGRLHHVQGMPLIVTYHPAYLLRNPQDKARAWDDLCLARALLRAPA